MYTLMQLQVSKRLKLWTGYLVVMLLFNILFTGIMELNNTSLDQNEGFYICNGISVLTLFLIAVMNMLKEQYSSQSRWIYLLPVRGRIRMTVKYLWLAIDVAGTVLINIICSLIIRIIYFKSLDAGMIFLMKVLDNILENGLIIMAALVLGFAVLSFAIVCTQTVFYQNRTLSMLFIGLLMMGVLVIISLISNMLSILLPISRALQHEQDIFIIIPIFEGGQWNIASIGILVLVFILCTAATAKIMDRHLNF